MFRGSVMGLDGNRHRSKAKHDSLCNDGLAVKVLYILIYTEEYTPCRRKWLKIYHFPMQVFQSKRRYVCRPSLD